MNKISLITSLLLKGCLFGNIAMAADDRMAQQALMAHLSSASLPDVKKKLLPYAKAGHANAQLAMAKLYESQDNYEPGLVVEWYKKSAVGGNPEAQFQLGLMYIDGEILNEDRDTGKFWVEQAAEQGHQRAKMVFDNMEIEDNSFGC